MLKVDVVREQRAVAGVSHPRGADRWTLPEIHGFLVNRLRRITARGGTCTISAEMRQTAKGFGLVLRARSESSRAVVFIPTSQLGENVTAEAIVRLQG